MDGLVLSDAARDLIINIINIIVLFIIVKALVYKPVKKFLNDRTDRVNKLKTEAEAKMAEAEESVAKYNELTEQSKEKGAQVVREAEKKAKENAACIIEEAKKSAADITAKAHTDAANEHDAALTSMKDDVVGIAFDISKQVLAREVTDEDNLRIADKFFEQFGNQ